MHVGRYMPFLLFARSRRFDVRYYYIRRHGNQKLQFIAYVAVAANFYLFSWLSSRNTTSRHNHRKISIEEGIGQQ